jgi:serine/threonine protein kinase
MNAGTVLTGRFRLEERLGQGAVGQVWRARDLKLNRDVAVKLLLADDADEVTFRRFLREAILPAAMQHPGIAVVHDADRHQGRPFIVTELLRGEDLGRLLKRHPKGLPVRQATDFAIQLADALAVAHEHGVVHRDLKPANLFIQAGDRLKICDFGMARDANATASLTAAGTVLGTPSYMSPEQWLGQDASPSMDIYAVGCILHEMLTGRVPFEAGDVGSWVALFAVLQRMHLS